MRSSKGLARFLVVIGLGLVALVGGGCEWSGDSEPDPSIMFEKTIDFYGASRANGEYVQKMMGADPKTATLTWGWSNRFARLISNGEWSTPEQADFIKDLRRQLLAWSSANYRALEARQAGDFSGMRADLKQADAIESQIDNLIATSEIEKITDGEFSGEDFFRNWRQKARGLEEHAPWTRQ